MRRVLIASVAIIAVATLPTLAAAQPAGFSWTGPYVGIAGGIGFGQSSQTDTGINLGDGSFNVQGGVIGGTAGFNWQNGPWVLGLEGDFSWAGISGSSDICGAASGLAHNCGTKLESLGTLRARLGHAFGAMGTWLVYATGGLAVGNVQAWDDFTPASGSEFRAGWTLGAGVETAVTPNWSAKLEYLYVDLGSGDIFDIIPGTPENVSFRASVVRLGLNYPF